MHASHTGESPLVKILNTFRSIPFHSVPFRSIRFHSIPFQASRRSSRSSTASCRRAAATCGSTRTSRCASSRSTSRSVVERTTTTPCTTFRMGFCRLSPQTRRNNTVRRRLGGVGRRDDHNIVCLSTAAFRMGLGGRRPSFPITAGGTEGRPPLPSPTRRT